MRAFSAFILIILVWTQNWKNPFLSTFKQLKLVISDNCASVDESG